MSESPTLTGLPVQRPKKSRFRLLKRILWLLLLVLVLLLIAGYLFQNLVGNTIFDVLTSKMSDELDTEVSCEKVAFTWKNGFELQGFRIANPEGFGPTAALQIQSAKMDMSLTSLLSGQYKAFGKLVAPEIEIRKNRAGKSNWEQLAENQQRNEAASGGGQSGKNARSGGSRQVTIRSHGEEADSLASAREMLQDLHLDFTIDKGKIQFVDEQQGERHAIEQLQLKLAASQEKHGALFHLAGVLTGSNTQKTSEVSLMATFPFDGPPTLSFKAPDGIRLQDYEGLISPFLEKRFESLAGTLRGELEARYLEKSQAVEMQGHLRLEGLDIVGGPMGEGIGIRTDLWTLDPALTMGIAEGAPPPMLEGTEADLGFLKLNVMPSDRAEKLLAKEHPTDAKTALGIQVEIDLAKMGQSILHPAVAGYTGKVVMDLALDPNLQDERTLPLALIYKATGLSQDKKVTGQDFAIPPEVSGKLVLDLEGGKEIQLGPLVEETKAPGLELHARLDDVMSQASKGRVKVALDPAKAKGWLGPNLPAGLDLLGSSKVDVELTGGKLGEDFPKLIEGKLATDGLTYDGNRLEKGHFKVHYAKGRLDLGSDDSAGEPTTLNKGPVKITARVDGLDKQGGDLDFSLQTHWKDGVAAWGLTPYLQYAFPFLAGLDIQKGARLAQLDYRSFASLDLDLSGKIPADKDQLSKAMGEWNGKGALSLKDGSFTPSQAFAGVMKLFGQKNKLNFREFTNGFSISKGRLDFKEARIGGGDGHLVLRGNTGLDGKLDINVDFTDLLSRHRDGKRILAAAGGKPIMAHMGGTLTSPDFPIQNLVQDLFKNAIQGGVKDILKGIQKGKKPEDSLKDLFKKLKGK